MQTLPLKEWLNAPAIKFPDSCSNAGMINTQFYLELFELLPSFHRTGPWLVGGTIRRMLAGERPTTDVDIMFKNKQQYEDYCSWLREHGAELVEETERQTTYKYEGWEIQPICAVFSNTLNQTLTKFDFTICQFGFDGTNLMWGDHSMEHLTEKRLVFTSTTDHVATMRRAFKYTNQGFFMDQEIVSKFLKSVIKDGLKVERDMKKWEVEANQKYASGHFRPSSSYS